MLRFFQLLVLLASFLSASDNIEIYAGFVKTEDNIVKAYGEVNVIYMDYLLSAKEAVYDKNSSILELFGNIRAKQGDKYKILGDYAKLNIANKEKTFQPFFILDNKSKIWISANKGCTEENKIDIESGLVSGCNPNDPLWKMEFTSSDYNTDTKWLNLYNTRIYIYDIPVFYTPYFGYSLDKERHSGLLYPDLGLSDTEGLYYKQSLYIAQYNWWDLELTPQVRTNRGYGAYSVFRFVDSNISRGKLITGYFKEKKEYFDAEQLVNSSHYGLNLKYDNSDFINQWFDSKLEGQSALHVDINNMNDVDYINLSINDTAENVSPTHVMSQVNMFYNNDMNYVGAYFKYYKDLTQNNNKNTLQKIPTLHLHNYIDSFLNNTILYNVDVQSNNIYREIDKGVVQTNINLPLTLQTSLFDEYINLSYSAKLYAQHSAFNGTKDVLLNEYNNGLFAREYNVFSASTQLTRAYKNFTHVAGFSSKYTRGSTEIRDGYYEDTQEFCSDVNNLSSPKCEFYNIQNIDEEVQFDFSQYIFDKTGKQNIYHRLAQLISYKDSQESVGELENELEFRIADNILFYNNMFFNYNKKTFSKAFNKITYTDYGFKIELSHLYKDNYLTQSDLTYPYTSYLTSSASYTYDDHYIYSMKYDYDLETNLNKSAEVGFLYKKRCWDFGLKYVENNRPTLTKDSESLSIFERYVYFTIALKPLMQSSISSGSSLKLSDSLKGL